MIYYISDTHFRDKTIFDKCNRPFKSLKEMEDTIIQNWNKRINNDDIIYVLGDLVKDDDASAIQIFEDIRESDIFETIKFIDLVLDKGRKVCICHYPLMDWMEFNRKGSLVYGHIHNKTAKNGKAYKLMKKFYKNLPAYNCGVDVCGFEPRTLDELIYLKEVNKDEAYIN